MKAWNCYNYEFTLMIILNLHALSPYIVAISGNNMLGITKKFKTENNVSNFLLVI